jgi:hypothetical protein
VAYVSFQDSKPVASDAGVDVVDDMRTNMMALRDAVVAGVMEGWNYAPSGGTAEQPATFNYTKGSERVRGSVTWGTTGGEAGNPTAIVWQYTANLSTYDTIGTQTIAYDSSGNVTSITWS